MNWGLYIGGGVFILLAIVGIVWFFVHRKYASSIFKHHAWKKLYRLSQDRDYYLLNNVSIKTETETIHLDHLLVGDKFVYAIATRYYEDNLSGASYSATRWHIVDKNGLALREISNPVYYNEARTMVLAKFLGWNDTKAPMFMSIVVINNSTEIKIADESMNDYSYLIHKKDVAKLIKQIEKDTNCPPFDDQSLNKIINRLHRISEENNRLEKEEQESKSAQ